MLASLDGLERCELDFFVVVDALVDELFDILGAFVEVELGLRVQSEHQGLLEVFEIVVHL